MIIRKLELKEEIKVGDILMSDEPDEPHQYLIAKVSEHGEDYTDFPYLLIDLNTGVSVNEYMTLENIRKIDILEVTNRPSEEIIGFAKNDDVEIMFKRIIPIF